MYDHTIIIIMYSLGTQDPVCVSAQNDTVEPRPLVGMRSDRYDVRHWSDLWKNDPVELDFRRGERLH